MEFALLLTYLQHSNARMYAKRVRKVIRYLEVYKYIFASLNKMQHRYGERDKTRQEGDWQIYE